MTDNREHERIIAIWTKRLGILTFLMVILSCISAYIMYLTNQTARMEQEASIYIKDIIIRTERSANGEEIYNFMTEWANGGTTRTKYFKYRQGCASKRIFGLDLDWKKFMEEHRQPWFEASIGPNATQKIFMCGGEKESYSRDLGNPVKYGLFAVGEAQYGDIYDNEHYLSFCFEAHNFSMNDVDIVFTPCQKAGSQFNCADEQCKK